MHRRVEIVTAGLPASFSRNDEWYDWTVNPAPNVRTLVTADESSYGSLGRQGTTHPITWCQEIDNGRSWYTGMGHEGTAYSELVDPVVQRERFTAQAVLAAAGDPEAMALDEDFLEALEYGMPPTGGMGMGMDRLMITLTGLGIRETILFPLLMMSINVGGLDAATLLPGFPADTYLD